MNSNEGWYIYKPQEDSMSSNDEIYMVGFETQPEDMFTEHKTEEDAFAAAMEMAEEEAEDRDIDPGTLGEYRGDELEVDSGRFIVGGVCPAGDDGAYWPLVVRVVESEVMK